LAYKRHQIQIPKNVLPDDTAQLGRLMARALVTATLAISVLKGHHWWKCGTTHVEALSQVLANLIERVKWHTVHGRLQLLFVRDQAILRGRQLYRRMTQTRGHDRGERGLGDMHLEMENCTAAHQADMVQQAY
jgi:hypothetical protein